MRTSAAGIEVYPHAPPLRGSLPPEGVKSARGGPARILAPTLVAARGFTLLELMVVVAIMAMATAGVSMAMRDTSQTQLERDAQRLAALLETARAHSRMSANTVVWRATPKGFVFEGLPNDALPTTWLGTDVVASSSAAVVLGPEPIIGPQRIRLASLSQPTRSLSITTDGVRPFKVTGDADVSTPAP
ncbi:prepilin-type N-terminal cleavage/methylation domain-containing protein [Rhodoferax sp. AJA081-3]|nr:prepilin-type N-terminal cleavage/methylation domain-containing protein [Rhodoferax sp. AJA081-3]